MAAAAVLLCASQPDELTIEEQEILEVIDDGDTEDWVKDPVIKIPFSNVYQHVCTYRDLYYKTFELPACPPGVDPIVTYPVALSCHCGRCAMDTSDCTFESLQPDFCMNDIPFYY
ncbi:gonadotropin subunit beta-2-like [Astatotilapia calliptera]|uniref:gonadotropin subunit beta-2-like n=1 Tax=Astatotilapia calliptera TaxID=8154 RepID=UPI000E4005D8|nr:gonadotropin subunit beta-2-like [Astatotilapia calliptera]